MRCLLATEFLNWKIEYEQTTTRKHIDHRFELFSVIIHLVKICAISPQVTANCHSLMLPFKLLSSFCMCVVSVTNEIKRNNNNGEKEIWNTREATPDSFFIHGLHTH